VRKAPAGAVHPPSIPTSTPTATSSSVAQPAQTVPR
jgi:hypothetical protein